jgi:hypothetical protein
MRRDYISYEPDDEVYPPEPAPPFWWCVLVSTWNWLKDQCR